MASSVSLLCVGCGKDLTDCSKTRKELGDDTKASDQATRISVLSAWRELAANTTNLYCIVLLFVYVSTGM